MTSPSTKYLFLQILFCSFQVNYHVFAGSMIFLFYFFPLSQTPNHIIYLLVAFSCFVKTVHLLLHPFPTPQVKSDLGT